MGANPCVPHGKLKNFEISLTFSFLLEKHPDANRLPEEAHGFLPTEQK